MKVIVKCTIITLKQSNKQLKELPIALIYKHLKFKINKLSISIYQMLKWYKQVDNMKKKINLPFQKMSKIYFNQIKLIINPIIFFLPN